MLTAPLFDIADYHIYVLTGADFDIDEAVYKYLFECKYCNRYVKITSAKSLTVKDFVDIGLNIEVRIKERE